MSIAKCGSQSTLAIRVLEHINLVPSFLVSRSQSTLAIRVLKHICYCAVSAIHKVRVRSRYGYKKERQRRTIDKWHLREVPYLLVGEGTIKE